MRSAIYKSILFFSMSFLLCTSSAFAASVPWRSYSNTVFTSAEASHKLVLLYVKSSSCHWCMRMNNETFRSPVIIQMIAKKFIPVSVDMSSNASISNKYGARGTPTFIILDGQGHELSRSTGYQSVNEFKSYLEGF